MLLSSKLRSRVLVEPQEPATEATTLDEAVESEFETTATVRP